MPRIARKHSETGTYHVFLRGINRQAIFEDTEDFDRFKGIIAKARDTSRFSLLGYCLMGNHVHLLMRVGIEDVGQSVKRVAGGYAAWFNWKYDRAGHLFQARFGSEPIETDDYLLAALRYIQRNPVAAKMCKMPEQYKWSSYSDYLGKGTGLTDITSVKNLVSGYSRDWRNWLIDFTQTENGDNFIDFDDRSRLTDAMLRQRAAELPGLSRRDSSGMPIKPERDDAIRSLRDEGFGLRQIARVTGIPYGIVRSR